MRGESAHEKVLIASSPGEMHVKTTGNAAALPLKRPTSQKKNTSPATPGDPGASAVAGGTQNGDGHLERGMPAPSAP